MSTEPKDSLSDQELDALFAAARTDGAPSDGEILPSAEFFAAILQDAEMHQPDAGLAPEPSRAPLSAPPFWVQLRDALGGWAGLGGLAAASVTGVMIGVSPPEAVSDVTALFSGAAEYTGAASGFDVLLSDEG